MNKDEYIKRIKHFKINKNAKQLFFNQIELFYRNGDYKYKKYNISARSV